MKYFFIIVSFFTGIELYAKSGIKYPVSQISDSLKNNAHAVIRYDNTEVEILGLDEVWSMHRYAVTILDEEGKYMADLMEHYSLLSKISDIQGHLYDVNGKELKSMKLKDMADFSSFTMSYVFHDDNRYKKFSFNHNQYPYTVEFEIEQLLKTTFFLPRWSPQIDHAVALEEANFTLTYPNSFTVREKEYLISGNVQREERAADERVIKTWHLSNIKAYDYQPYSRQSNFSTPTVVLGPGDFQLMDYTGNMDSWTNFGLFMYKLNKDRDRLPEDKRSVIKALADKEPDTRKKIQLLYEYMQQNTRYVANEYGIAGWQTFDAENVGKNGYGDCKGLTNYMKAILNEAGITSYAALIYAGAEEHYKIDTEFPANNFNHMILCVPSGKDSIWIECTSQQLPAGYLGSFTQNRYALLITENGGVLCKTPSYGKDKSFVLRNATVRYEDHKKQQIVKFNNKYSGIFQDDLLHSLKVQPESKIKDELNKKFSFPTYSIADFNYQISPATELPCIEENVTAVVSGIVTGTQKRTFIDLSWIGNPMKHIAQQNKRTEPLVLEQSLRIVDTITIIIPENVSLESIPKQQMATYVFASYNLEVIKSDRSITMIRSYEQNEGIYAIDDFEHYQKMYGLMEADRARLSVVLLNE